MDDVYLKPKIPDGQYVVEFTRYYTAEMFKKQGAKVCLGFGIVEGNYAGFELQRFYSAACLIGPTGEDGGFKAKSQTSVMLMEYCTCFPDQEIKRLDRIPMSRWKEGKFIVQTRTPKRNHQGSDTPTQLQYSVIDKIIKRVE
jgi:hypothetical protein|tara:strand:- start:89 stop:514 length:426 start_codon:yes stop_codon:yes gene_type:complete